MNILVVMQGNYGQRILEHIQALCPDNWVIGTISLPRNLPILIDEPEDYLPSLITPTELILALIESEGAAQLIPSLTVICGAKAVIMPVDNPGWLRLGLQNQLKEELTVKGVDSVFPRTFCTLTEYSTGFRGKAKTYESEIISNFAAFFGKPKLSITTDTLTKRIVKINVERGSPCGSTSYVANKLADVLVDKLISKAGLMVHQFPCLAAM